MHTYELFLTIGIASGVLVFLGAVSYALWSVMSDL
jgi:hypothetical protein